MRCLIVNADDFGLNEDTFNATVACFEAGLLTSATILAGMPYTAQACEYARRNAGRFSFGMHFNLTDGKPLSGACASLCDKNGNFRPDGAQRMHALAGLMSSAEVRNEFRAQLGTLLDHGVSVSHVDGHFHVHKLPTVLRAIKDEMHREGIRYIRRPQNFYPGGRGRSTFNKLLFPLFKGLNYADYYFAAEPYRVDWHLRMVAALPEGVSEMSIHPGQEQAWRRAEAAPFVQPDELRGALIRHGVSLRRYDERMRITA